MLPLLRDCISNDPKETELFIFSDWSWYEQAKQDRKRETQALMGVDRTRTFTNKTRIDKVLEDRNMRAVIVALGAGFDFPSLESGHKFDLSLLRYHKIILVSDMGSPTHRAIFRQTTSMIEHFLAPALPYVFRADPELRKATFQDVWESAINPESRTLAPVFEASA